MDETDGNLRDHFRRAGFAEFPIRFEGYLARISQISYEPGLFRIFSPEFEVTDSKKVLIINQQFLLVGASHIGQLDLSSFDVPDALLPSAMFCLPDRAA